MEQEQIITLMRFVGETSIMAAIIICVYLVYHF